MVEFRVDPRESTRDLGNRRRRLWNERNLAQNASLFGLEVEVKGDRQK